MEAQFWLDKWEKQETGFHLSAIHPLLQKFYARVFRQKLGVFVPLCGKTSDLTLFAQKGSYTLGCELSDIAARAFFDSAGLKATERTFENFKSFKANNLEILVGDFFDLQRSQVKNCPTIYDRASLIALPSSMRVAYVAKLKSLFKSARMLLITLQYPQAEMKGPPFSVPQSEVEDLFSFASVTPLYAKNILEKEPKFAARGLSALEECVYMIEWSN